MRQLILVEESPSEGSRHRVTGGVTIGREDCEIVLADPEVSRAHARIRSLDDALAIEDLQSTNGTFLNGRPVTGIAELKDGDSIKLGHSSLRVTAEREDGATRMSPPQRDPANSGGSDPGTGSESEPPGEKPHGNEPQGSKPSAARAPSSPPPVEAIQSPAPGPPPPVERREPRGPAADPAFVEAPPPTSPAPVEASPADQPIPLGNPRGDVPPPEPRSASRVHVAVKPEAAPPGHAFQAARQTRRRRTSAATRIEATMVSYGAVIATAAAIAVYLTQR